MDHKDLLVQITARIDRLEDRVTDCIDGLHSTLSDHQSRVKAVETNNVWIVGIGSALLAGAWTAIVALYKTL